MGYRSHGKGQFLRGRTYAQRHSNVNCVKTAEPIEMPLGLWTRGMPKEACIRWGPDLPCVWAIIRGKEMPRHAARRHCQGMNRHFQAKLALQMVNSHPSDCGWLFTFCRWIAFCRLRNTALVHARCVHGRVHIYTTVYTAFQAYTRLKL